MLCGVGNNCEEVWSSLLAGKSGVARITYFDTSQFPCQIAAEVKNFDPLNFIEKKELKKMGRFIHVCLAATDEAMKASGLKVTPEIATRVGVHIGSGIGGFDVIEREHKALLEGGIEGRPDNVIFYATSNRRHLMPRDMMENERSTAINPGEAVEEKVSLSDRFGLWLGFHRCSQDEYLAMVESYVAHYKIPARGEALQHDALEWSTTRGSRSGRVAWQFVQDLAGRLGVKMKD